VTIKNKFVKISAKIEATCHKVVGRSNAFTDGYTHRKAAKRPPKNQVTWFHHRCGPVTPWYRCSKTIKGCCTCEMFGGLLVLLRSWL